MLWENRIRISAMQNEEQLKKQQEFLHKARKGVLNHLNDKGGMLNMADLHDFSMKTYFIQHQGFSRLMEGFVGEDLVIYDNQTQDVIITDKGKDFAAGPSSHS
jgi:hypothetical protein